MPVTSYDSESSESSVSSSRSRHRKNRNERVGTQQQRDGMPVADKTGNEVDGETEREVVETDITLPDDPMIDLRKSKHRTHGDLEEEPPIPSLDDSLYQRLMQIKGSTASKSSIDRVETSLYNLQQKVLDSTRPLTFLLGEDMQQEEHHEAIRDTLDLIAVLPRDYLTTPEEYFASNQPILLISIKRSIKF
ncbi:hypothetical protein OUZ56_016371 [Daphnia magna]|uniref:Intraflagellar transport protein 46 homolog n=1 Tax=Daphnia magna TaxID=35525 RepID=A0ABR0AQH0_9CRUS|nr:hypothetical protein OUZ56_016371 [Daphnia magna]